MENRDLAIPLYLDTNTLLDLLASIEGGFSMVEKITTRSADSKTTELSGGTEFGIANVFNILKINLKGSGTKTKDQQLGEEREVQRYHTYGSLLNRLRTNLMEAELVKKIVDDKAWEKVNTSEFVEVRGKFVPNPLRVSLQIINRLLGMILPFRSFDLTSEGKAHQPQKKAKQEIQQIQNMQKIFEGIIKNFEHESIYTYLVELTALPGHRTVVYLFTEYLRDRSNTELPYSEFRVLGKVVKKITEKDDSIDLLRGSALSGVSEEILSPLLDALRQVGEQGIKIPNLVTKVEAPAIQIIPIAVYV
ncbi:MAG TPA: DUF6414 family protein [Candidatus Brocadiia bacterium]|nr:hypothetical protein [Planctomycetota bacterium]MDO8093094.1 hypothetical protein [Candidatus Brocadiales bacterium]